MADKVTTGKLAKQDSAWSALLGDDDFSEQDVRTVRMTTSPYLLAKTPSKQSISSKYGRGASANKLQAARGSIKNALESFGDNSSSTMSTPIVPDNDLPDELPASYESDTVRRIRNNAAKKESAGDTQQSQRPTLHTAFFDSLSSKAGVFSVSPGSERFDSVLQYQAPPTVPELVSPTLPGEEDPELLDMMILADESAQARKPLKLTDPATTSLDKMSALESITTSTSNLSMSTSEDTASSRPGEKKKILKSNLTAHQVDDLQSFLNDEEYEDQVLKESSKAGAIFGSFAPEITSGTDKENQQDLPTDLVQLDFSYGQELPVKNWGSLIAANAGTLETVCFAHNNLQSLPENELKQAVNLRTLDFSFNKLESLPKAITHLGNLVSLEVRVNILKTAGPFSETNSKLERLIMYKNQITSVDDSISKLRALRVVDFSGNRLTEFPSSLIMCASLVQLDLSGNHITALTGTLRALNHLQRLNLSKNKISVISNDLKLPLTLVDVDLSCICVIIYSVRYLLHYLNSWTLNCSTCARMRLKCCRHLCVNWDALRL
jgi:Leucine-rich repeat (LRR) protein